MTTANETIQSAESAELFLEADILLRAGHPRQASGKAWEATAHCIRTISDSRGWQRAETGTHDEVGSLIHAAGLLAKESDDPERIIGLSMTAGALYINSLEDWYTEITVKGGIGSAKELVARLERFNGATG